MKNFSLRTKILLSVGFIIFVVLGTSTIVHIRDLRQDYLEALSWRSEALAQQLISEITDLQRFGLEKVGDMLPPLSLRCIKLYELNKDKNISHFAVIDSAGKIGAHNNKNLWDTPIESQVLHDHLQLQKQTTVLDGDTYHTLFPVFGEQETYLATIDIGTPKSFVDEKIQRLIRQSGILFVLFLLMTFFTISFLMHVLITKPVRQLVLLGQQLAAGNLVQIPQKSGQGDEIAILSSAFSRISAYLQNLAEVASHIATGLLNGKVRVRSEQDILGKAVQEMLQYLRHVADVAARIAEGDLTGTVQVRSATDAFGHVIQKMTEGLRSLIKQIRNSAEQIATTGQAISSLSKRDIRIVHDVHTSAETMIATVREMGSSVEEVAHNMEILSSSVEMTSVSVTQMTSSIAHIAANTNELTEQTHKTIDYLESTVQSLEEVVNSTDVSKQLSQGTMQEALQGQQVVEQVIASMETIQKTITTAVDTITRFEQRSQDIDTILDVIREITDQTSLLALNASIIAAQAGVHGRGFAVVADEIRNLASGVSASTKDIAAIVQTLQQDTNQVVQTIHAGAEDVKQGMERTQQARETLEKIITSAQRSSAVVTEITDTLHELMSASRNVSESMERVNVMTNDITAATNEQEASTTQINQAVENINDMASQIQRATTEQLSGVHHVLDAMNRVTTLIAQNLESSQQITDTTKELSLQADSLLHSVARFKLPAQV
jgi:methyl-accepting chemotaxis protein